ncbi:MAG TPA: cytochrome b/b6 domain-containing protein [Polyangia bacterium]|nr:cytochrome b/b6 domain-containing protein [Polyangia bacterium]
MSSTRPRHHWIVRVTHWVNALALFIMIGSGLRIFNSYPAFARKGESFCCYPFAGHKIPTWLTFGGWLAGARHWHFAAMWMLVANGLVYLGFIYLHGEWRDLVPRRGVARDSVEMVKFYLALRKEHPRQGKHNALQRMAYFTMPYVGIAAVVSGLAIWKPVQLAPLTHLLGGFVWARYWHFLAMLLLVFLTLGHVFMVFAVDPYSLRSMVTGGYDETRSPEARNARPFIHLFTVPNPRPEPNPQPPAGDPPKPATPEADPPPAQPPVGDPKPPPDSEKV